MSQSYAIAISVILIVIAIAVTWWSVFRIGFNGYRESIWVGVVLPVALWAIALGSLIWSLDDNFYDVKSGVVIGQTFTPAYITPVTCTSVGNTTVCSGGVPIPDDWAIEIRGTNGKTGSIHFGTNVFAEYPKGSLYPH